MEFLQLAKERHSVRHYLSQPVEEAKLQSILEAGRIAPTAANKQPQRFMVISTDDGLAKLSKAATLHGAPLAIVICGRKDSVWVRPQDGHDMLDIDTTIATTHMMLEAWAQGIASCWITYFDPAIVRQEFTLPPTVEAVNILVLGYAADTQHSADRHAQQRMPLEDMVWREAVPSTIK